ncbi:uncharacterized protein LOC128954915 [Oppia nitens]|uniref:uncharacterized protein LOC128954915 n=1 Tax=Oppia nitens TaxID=1686743 RepID=UPI0023D9EEE6|nr:uncharacterized protein LOC128954915 [Oppia nitens]
MVANNNCLNANQNDNQQQQQQQGLQPVNYRNNTIGIRYNGTVCLLMAFKSLNISVTSKTTDKTFMNQIIDDSDEIQIIVDRSSCLNITDQTQRLALNVSGNYLEFVFKKNMTTKLHKLSLIMFEVENQTLFDGTTVKNGNISKMSPDLKAKQLGGGYSFECRHKYTFRFNATETEEIKVSIIGLKFSAFRKKNNGDFDKRLVQCEPPKTVKPGSDTVPIAVGGVLTGFLVISLVGYLVIRARKA